MGSLGTRVWSSVGKKLISGFTGLSLVIFVCGHLTGNLLLLAGADAFNSYAYFLEHVGHGVLIYVAEAGLVLFFLLHIVSGVSVWRRKAQARPVGYAVQGDAGAPSHKSLSSRSMLLSGLCLAIYVPLHVAHFKYGGPAIIQIDGHEARDLYSLVVREFKNPVIVALYTGAMLFLGLHLRHGVWSMLQSLGLLNRRLLPPAITAAVILSSLLAIGFILLPLYVYLNPQVLPLTGGLG